MIFTVLATLICIWLLVEAYKAKERQKKLIQELATLKDNNCFFIKQIDHYLAEVNRLSEENAHLYNESNNLANDLQELKSQQQSKSVRLGMLTENVLPLHVDFGIDHKCLVPMFRPIDYVAFQEDSITFIEIKSGSSQLSQKQRNIRSLIEQGKVYFKEIRVNEYGLEVK